MRKVMLLAAMLAMVLAAAAPPAFAQAIAGDTSVQYVDCSQVQSAAAQQGQYGDATAGDVSSAAAIAQELNITQEQVNACLGGVAAGENILVGPRGGVIRPGAEAAAPAAAAPAAAAPAAAAPEAAAAPAAAAPAPAPEAAAAPAAAAPAAAAPAAAAPAAAAPTGVLPETGGASLLVLGAGALLVAGGLLARRIIR